MNHTRPFPIFSLGLVTASALTIALMWSITADIDGPGQQSSPRLDSWPIRLNIFVLAAFSTMVLGHALLASFQILERARLLPGCGAILLQLTTLFTSTFYGLCGSGQMLASVAISTQTFQLPPAAKQSAFISSFPLSAIAGVGIVFGTALVTSSILALLFLQSPHDRLHLWTIRLTLIATAIAPICLIVASIIFDPSTLPRSHAAGAAEGTAIIIIAMFIAALGLGIHLLLLHSAKKLCTLSPDGNGN